MATIGYYTANASDIALRYENVDPTRILANVSTHLKNAGKVLELGCGSGRDSAALFSMGFEITALDGSSAMLEQAQSYHPELAGRLHLHQLPAPLPFNRESFDAVIAIAVLLHLTKHDIIDTLREIHRVLAPDGRLIYSVNTARPGLDDAGLDGDGRHFTVMSRREWEDMNHETGFRLLEAIESEDVIGRDGVKWISFVLTKAGDEK